MLASPERLTKKQKRVLRQEKILDTKGNIIGGNIKLENIKPMTDAQRDVFDAFEDGHHLMLHGSAGTGKTFIGLWLALDSILNKKLYKKVFIVRSVVPTRDMGFLPGNTKEKTKIYETPYYNMCQSYFERGDAYDILKTKSIIEFMSTSFIRGLTLDNCVLLVDEVQNMSAMELHSIMTRVGENCRIVFCGDVHQDDLTSERKKELSGLREFMKIIKELDEFDFVEFSTNDIVRSDLVKSYIVMRHKLGID